MLKLKEEEKITSLIPVRTFDDRHFLLMATRRGLVKKTALTEYSRIKTGGIIGISLDEGDTLIGVALTKAGDEVVLCTRNGMAIRFDEADARPIGRNTRGVRGISLQKDDEVVGMVVADPEGYLLTVCENGYGKRTPFGANTAGEPAGDISEDGEALREGEAPAEPPPPKKRRRGSADGEPEAAAGEEVLVDALPQAASRRQGRPRHPHQQRNGRVVGVTAVRDADDMVIISSGGMVTRMPAHEIRVAGRNTQGVRVINLKESDKVASLAKVVREEEEIAEAGDETAATPEEA